MVSEELMKRIQSGETIKELKAELEEEFRLEEEKAYKPHASVAFNDGIYFIELSSKGMIVNIETPDLKIEIDPDDGYILTYGKNMILLDEVDIEAGIKVNYAPDNNHK